MAMHGVGAFIRVRIELDCVTGRITTSANAKKNNLVLNGGSSLRERSAIIGGFACFVSQAEVDKTGRILLSLARRAWLSRQVELLDETILTIQALPLDPRLHAVAEYYRAYALDKSDDIQLTQGVLETLVYRVPAEYRSRLLLAIGNCRLASREVAESRKVYLETARAATGIDPLTKCSALRMLALARSYEGDHQGSLADLERLFPVNRSFAAIYPEDYRYYLNNLAYELGEVGRIDEAKAAINVALRSPYADRFPDWAETAQELETKQRRLFLPLVFALGSPALGSPAAAFSTAAMAAEQPAALVQTVRPEPEASTPAQPESQPDIQTSPARRISPELKRNRNSGILILLLARLACRGLDRARPPRQSQQPTFQSRGCGRSPSARAPPFSGSLF
jgi:tetratricopeptide (TPR) repeat protein